MRPTVSLVVIAKNEINNIQRWYDSVSGLFDEYIFCDTGSTDGTIEKATALGLHVIHFDWVDDFSAARNFAYSHATSDYVFWTDLDDTISDKVAFQKWRDNSMGLYEYWLAPYHYALDDKGQPVCSFIRERCWKSSLGLKWQYFVHEGVQPIRPNGLVSTMQFAKTWAMLHHRTMEDLLKDKGRNLRIFEQHIARNTALDPRMHYYYGKELFEANQAEKGAVELAKAATNPKLELHDRILCHQYAASAFGRIGKLEEAMAFSRLGLELAPQRAEFWVLIGDCKVAQQKFLDAIPFYAAAKKCENINQNPQGFVGLIFTLADAYGSYPGNNIARCYMQLGRFEEAEREAKETFEKFHHPDSKLLAEEIVKFKNQVTAFTKAPLTEEIVFTCPGGLYEWDADLAKTKGFGGSEQACIHMAREMHKQSGRPVKVFNIREKAKVCEDGVEYLPVTMIQDYFSKNKPALHIAWRHNFKMTDAKTFLWSHDLFTPGAENMGNYTRYMCLSNFHKDYVSSLFGIPEGRIFVTKNGIVSDKFTKTDKTKNPLKIIFSNSPDRGLEKVIKICDLVREVFHVELYVFYGFDNMRKMGLNDQANKFEAMIKERPWIHNIGNIDHAKLLEHYDDAAIWLYPTDFLETSCITAMECVSKGVFPIVRQWGALPDTLAHAKQLGMCEVLDLECNTDAQHKQWANQVVHHITEKSWQKIDIDPKIYDWSHVARQWLDELPKLEP